VFTYLLIDEAHAFQVYGEKNEEGYFQSSLQRQVFEEVLTNRNINDYIPK
jgi:hypothetical protein